MGDGGIKDIGLRVRPLGSEGTASTPPTSTTLPAPPSGVAKGVRRVSGSAVQAAAPLVLRQVEPLGGSGLYTAPGAPEASASLRAS